MTFAMSRMRSFYRLELIMNLRFVVAIASLGLAAVPASSATITSLYNTGTNASNVATTGNGVDLHWGLADGTAYTGGVNGNFPIGPWLAETSTSRWLTPTPSAGDYVDATDYTYSTTFSLSGFNAATASISGLFAGDDQVSSIRLNGVTFSAGAVGFSSFTSFATSTGFVAGANTLTFVTHNDGGPAGLRVEVGGTADATGAVPEPSMWGLMVVGFGLVGSAARRRGTTVVA